MKKEIVVTNSVTSPLIAGPAWRAISSAIKKLIAVLAARVIMVLVICRFKVLLLAAN